MYSPLQYPNTEDFQQIPNQNPTEIEQRVFSTNPWFQNNVLVTLVHPVKKHICITI